MLEIDKIYCSDCLEVMKDIPDKSIDLIVTDPPYGYSFMGKDWDKAVIGVDYWKECLRVLKDGAFAFIMSAPRQDVLSRMIVNLQDAGFIVGFTSIYWCFASGFPKAGNISKLVDKRMGAEREVVGTKYELLHQGSKPGTVGDKHEGYQRPWNADPEAMGYMVTIPSTPEAKALDGSYGGFQPKPALEVVLVVMKPLAEKTYVDQALANGHGVTWLDDGRIPLTDNADLARINKIDKGCFGVGNNNNTAQRLKEQGLEYQGRFSANLLCSDDVLNDGNITGASINGSGKTNPVKRSTDTLFFKKGMQMPSSFHGDIGSFSRYFDLDAWWDNRIKLLPESIQKTFPFMIIPKASKSEKNKGCDGKTGQSWRCSCGAIRKHHDSSNCPKVKGNVHPCVKPVKLFSYLITLGSREGDLILDPFAGSGTSCVSAKMLNRHYIGIERESEYINIAEARIKAEQVQPGLQLAGG